LTSDSGLCHVAIMQKQATFIRLEPALKQALAQAAELDGRSLSSLIAKILSDWLKARGK